MAKSLNVNLSFTADTSQAKAALQSLQSQLTSLTNGSAQNIGSVLAQDMSKAVTSAAELKAHLQNATNIKTGSLDFTKFQQSLASSGLTLTKLGQNLTKMGSAGQTAFVSLARSISQAEVPMTRFSQRTLEMVTTLKNAVRWQISSSVIHGALGAIQGAYSYAQRLNESLNNIQIVTGQSSEQMAKFAEQANKAAKSLSTTTTSYTDAALIFYQQGLKGSDVTDRTDVVVKMANVTGESAKTVSDQMTAVWNNFYDGSHSLEYYADVMTALGAATASSTDEISQGLEKFASIADTVGLSYDHAAAALATVTATTRQSADVVGTAFKTIFARVDDLKLGKTLEDGTDLGKYSAALLKVGVNIKDSTGELKTMDNIIDEIGGKWQTLSKDQQIALAQAVAGTRQYVQLMALMNNFDFYKENLDVAEKSKGSLQKQQDIYAESWEAAQKRVKAASQAVFADLVNDKAFISILNVIEKIVDGVDSFIDSIGGLKGVLLTLGAAATYAFKDKIANGIRDAGLSIKSIFVGQAGMQAAKQEQIESAVGAIDTTNFSIGDQQKIESLKVELDLQEQLNAKASKMTEIELNTAKALMDSVRATADQYAIKKQQLADAQKNSANTRGNLAFVLERNNEDSEKFMKEAMPKLNAGKYSTLITELTKNLGTLGTESSKVEEQLNKIFASAGVKIPLDQGRMKELITELKEGKINAQEFSEQLVSSFNMLYGGDAAIEELTQKLVSLGVDENVAKKAATEFVATLQQEAQAALDANKAMDKHNASVKAAGDKLKQAGTKVSFSGFLTGASQALMAIGSISSAADGMFETFEDGSKTTSEKITGIAGSLGTVIMTVGMLGSALSAVMGPWGMAIAAIGAIGLGIYKAYEHFGPESNEKQLKRLSNETELAQSAAEQAKQAYDNLLSGQSKHNELLDSLEELVEGTNEFRQALLNANNAALDLIKTNGLVYGQDWNFNDKGAIVFTDQGQQQLEVNQKSLMDYQVETSLLAQSASLIEEAVKYSQSSVENESDVVKALMNQYQDQVDKGIFGGDFESFLHSYSRIYPSYDSVLANAIPDILSSTKNAGFSLNDIYYQKNFDLIDSLFSTRSMNDVQRNDLHTLYNNTIGSIIGADGEVTNAESLAQRILDRKFSVDKIASLDSQWGTYTDQQGNKYDLRSDAFGEIDSKQMETIFRESFSDAAFLSLQADESFSSKTEDQQKQHMATLIKENEIRKVLTQEVNSTLSTIPQQFVDIFADTANMDPNFLFAMNSRIENGDYASIQSMYKDIEFTDEVKEAFELLIGDGIEKYTTAAQDFQVAVNTFTNGTLTALDGSVQEIIQGKKLTEAELKQATSIITRFGGIGKDTGTAVANGLFGDFSTGLNQSLVLALQSVDLSSGVQGLFDLHGKINEYTGSLRDSLQDIYDAALKDFGGKGGVLQDILSSEDMKSQMKKFNRIINKGMKLTAQDILSAADGCSVLEQYLDDCGYSATTIADVLNNLGGDPTGIYNISTALIEAMDAANNCEDSIAELFDYIDDWKMKRSVGEFTDFLSKIIKQIDGSFEAGLTADDPVIQGIQEVYGSGVAARYIQELSDMIQSGMSDEEIKEAVNATFGPNFKMLQDIYDSGNFAAAYEFYGDALASKGITYKDGVVYADSSQGVWSETLGRELDYTNYEDFLVALQESDIQSEFLLNGMAAQFRAGNPNAYYQWGATDVRNGISRMAEVAKEENNNIVAASDVEAFAKNYEIILRNMIGEETGVKADEIQFNDIIDWLSGRLQDFGIELMSLSDTVKNGEVGLSDFEQELSDATDGHISNLTELFAQTGTKFGAQSIQDEYGLFKHGYDIDQARQAIMSTGVTEQGANEYLQQAADDGMNLIKTFTDKFGNSIQMQLEQGQSMAEFELLGQQKIAEMEAQHMGEIQANALRDAFAQGVSDLQISFKFVGENGELVAQIFAGGEVPITAAIDGEPTDKLVNYVQALNGKYTCHLEPDVKQVNAAITSINGTPVDLKLQRAEGSDSFFSGYTTESGIPVDVTLTPTGEGFELIQSWKANGVAVQITEEVDEDGNVVGKFAELESIIEAGDNGVITKKFKVIYDPESDDVKEAFSHFKDDTFDITFNTNVNGDIVGFEDGSFIKNFNLEDGTTIPVNFKIEDLKPENKEQLKEQIASAAKNLGINFNEDSINNLDEELDNLINLGSSIFSFTGAEEKFLELVDKMKEPIPLTFVVDNEDGILQDLSNLADRFIDAIVRLLKAIGINIDDSGANTTSVPISDEVANKLLELRNERNRRPEEERGSYFDYGPGRSYGFSNGGTEEDTLDYILYQIMQQNRAAQNQSFDAPISDEEIANAYQLVQDFYEEIGDEGIQAELDLDSKPAEAEINRFKAAIPEMMAKLNLEITPTFATPSSGGQSSSGAETQAGNALGGYVQSYASGSKVRQVKSGVSLTGEEGPEIVWNKTQGYSYIAGKEHPEFHMLQPGDRVFNAQETKQILNTTSEGKMLSADGGVDVVSNLGGAFMSWAKDLLDTSGNKSSKKASSGSGSEPGQTWQLERYHLIKEQIKDLEDAFDSLSKSTDRAFGTEKLKLIEQQTKALEDQVVALKKYAKEAADWRESDLQDLRNAGVDLELGVNGELLNYDELAEQYQQAAKDGKDKEAERIWNLLMSYEQANNTMQEQLKAISEKYDEIRDNALERITTEIEYKVEVSEANINILDYMLGNIEDDAYAAGRAIALMGKKMGEIATEINTATDGISDIIQDRMGNYFLSQAEGYESWSQEQQEEYIANRQDDIDRIVKGFLDGTISAEELQSYKYGDNGNAVFDTESMEAIQDQVDSWLDYLGEIRSQIGDAIGLVSSAFSDFASELNDEMASYDIYDSIANNYKDLIQLYGTQTLGLQNDILKTINSTLLQNARNTKASATQTYNTLAKMQQDAQKVLEEAIQSGDSQIIRERQQALDDINSQVLDAQQKMIDADIAVGKLIADQFEENIQTIVSTFESALSPLFGNLDYLQQVFSRQSEISDEYLEDYERFYELGKLMRNINGAIDDTKNIKGKQELKKLADEINDLQADGVEMSEYDLEVLQKRFELKKAELALSEAQDAKSIVRLSRDSNGNWGYVYTADDDNVAKAEQEYEDRLKEMQDANRKYIDDMSSELLDAQSKFKDMLADANLAENEELRQRKLEEAQSWYAERIGYITNELGKGIENNEDLFQRMLDTYGKSNANYIHDFSDTILSAVTGFGSVDEIYANSMNAMADAMIEVQKAYDTAQEEVSKEGYSDTIESNIEQIGEASNETAEKIESLADTISTAFDGALESFQDTFSNGMMEELDGLIAKTENLTLGVTNLIGAMKLGEDYKGLNLDDVAGGVSMFGSTRDSEFLSQYGVPSGFERNLENADGNNAEDLIQYYGNMVQSFDDTIQQAVLDQEMSLSSLLSDIMFEIGDTGLGDLEQSIVINASFPEATNSDEIQRAFDNMLIEASQYANRKFI